MALLLLSAMAVVGACSTAPAQVAPGGDCAAVAARHGHTQMTKISVATLPIPDGVAAQLAISHCYFAQEGIEVKLERIANVGAALPSLQSGLFTASLGNYPTIFQNEAKHPGTYAYLADAYQASTGQFVLAVRADSPITQITPKQLAGKTVGMAGLNSIAELQLRNLLKLAGMRWNDIKVVEMPFPDMPQALRTRQLDAVLVTEPFLTAMQTADGIRIIGDAMTGAMANYPISGWVTTRQTIKQYPALMAGLARALHKGQKLAATDRNAVQSALPQYTNINPEIAKTIRLGTFPTTLHKPRLERVVGTLREEGWVDRDLDIGPMLEFATTIWTHTPNPATPTQTTPTSSQPTGTTPNTGTTRMTGLAPNTGTTRVTGVTGVTGNDDSKAA